jgi:hypothetical protein
LRKAAASLIYTIILAATLLPFSVPAGATNVIGINPNSGRVGQSISFTGLVNYPGDRFELYWNSVAPANLLLKGTTVTSAASADFIVPEAPRAKYNIVFLDVDDQTQASSSFSVLPSFSATPETGAAGTRLTVSGKGFNAGETGIRVTWDGTEIGLATTANEKGSWTTTIDVPPAARGDHTLSVYGAVATIQETGTDSFSIMPQLFVSPTALSGGATLNVSGAGFAASENGITIIVDGTPVATDIVADAKGSWNRNYTVPAGTSKGTHTVTARGALTLLSEITPVTFSIAPNIRITPSSGLVGATITVTGAGFAPSEPGITVSYDGLLIGDEVTADANGAWTASLKAPAGIRGRHPVRANGTTTHGGDVAAVNFTIGPRIAVTPLNGAIGSEVTVTGDGFDNAKPVVLTYDGETIIQGTSSREGGFELKFKVPQGKSGAHVIVVKDTAGDLQATFTIEGQAPAAPAPQNPEANAQAASSTPTFEWAPVTDPSDVTYSFELSQTPDITKSLISRSGLTATTLTLTIKEALQPGAYYWRVRATDGAGNVGAWSTTAMFTIPSPFPLWALILSIVGGVAVVAGIAIWLIRRNRYDF